MNILIVVGDQRYAEDEARGNAAPQAVIRLKPVVTVQAMGGTAMYRAIRDERDVDQLRGLRFDLVVEDGSFNRERSYKKGALLELVKMIVLR